MGNLVTNRITLSGQTGGIEDVVLQQLAGELTGLDPAVAHTMIRDGEAGYGAWIAITLNGVVPHPDLFAKTDLAQPGRANLAMALISGPVDYIALTDHQYPYESLMPPEMSRTRLAILERHGLKGMTPDMAVETAEARYPGISGDAEVLRARVDRLGVSDPIAWREEYWGTRATAEDGLFMITEDGGFSVRFDTLNSGPLAFVKALAARYPDLQLQACGYDEDTDYSYSAVSDGVPGEICCVEQNDREAVEEAIDFVHRRDRPDNTLEMEP